MHLLTLSSGQTLLSFPCVYVLQSVNHSEIPKYNHNLYFLELHTVAKNQLSLGILGKDI